MQQYYVYILSSKKNGVLYIGVTNDLRKRVREHIQGQIEGFTKKYHVKRLVCFEATNDIKTAIQREKRLKRRKRDWKIELIEKTNLDWSDLSIDL